MAAESPIALALFVIDGHMGAGKRSRNATSNRVATGAHAQMRAAVAAVIALRVR
jgi:hypothetical protein